MERLPEELCIKIASYLDSVPPSVDKFNHRPSTQLTQSCEVPLKSLSCVSWRLRRATLEYLFRYVRIDLDKECHWIYLDIFIAFRLRAMGAELSNHEQEMYRKYCEGYKAATTENHQLFYTLDRIEDCDDFLKSVNMNMMWLPQLPRSFADFGHFIKLHKLEKKVKSVVVQTDRNYEPPPIPRVAQMVAPQQTHEVNEIWQQIFGLLEPLRVVVVAPPTTLAGLLALPQVDEEFVTFDTYLHYIELLQPGPHPNYPINTHEYSLILWRPWYHCGCNEGSSIPLYKDNNYWDPARSALAPSVLVEFSYHPEDSITSFEFIGIFPTVEKAEVMAIALRTVGTLTRVTLQITPLPEQDVGDDEIIMIEDFNLYDLWSEAYHVFGHFVDFVVDYSWKDGSQVIVRDSRRLIDFADSRELFDVFESRGWRSTDEIVWIKDLRLDLSIEE